MAEKAWESEEFTFGLKPRVAELLTHQHISVQHVLVTHYHWQKPPALHTTKGGKAGSFAGACAQSWLEYFPLYPKWKMLIHHPFPLCNSCYLSSLTEVFVTFLEPTYFAWPCNYWNYGCYLWLRQIPSSAPVPGSLVIRAPESSCNSTSQK